MRREATAAFNRKTKRRHGVRQHELYNTWNLIKERCTNPQWRYFADYGGRGIGLWQPWLDPARFIADIELELGPRPPGRTLNRIDNDGDYKPGNVEWASGSRQATNQRPRRTVQSLQLPPPDVLALAGVRPSGSVVSAVVALLS